MTSSVAPPYSALRWREWNLLNAFFTSTWLQLELSETRSSRAAAKSSRVEVVGG